MIVIVSFSPGVVHQDSQDLRNQLRQVDLELGTQSNGDVLDLSSKVNQIINKIIRLKTN